MTVIPSDTSPVCVIHIKYSSFFALLLLGSPFRRVVRAPRVALRPRVGQRPSEERRPTVAEFRCVHAEARVEHPWVFPQQQARKRRREEHRVDEAADHGRQQIMQAQRVEQPHQSGRARISDTVVRYTYSSTAPVFYSITQ